VKPLRPNWWLAYPGGDYLWRGRDPVAGIDCWGLYAHVQRHDFGRAVNDFGWVYPLNGAAGREQARAFAVDEVRGWRQVDWEEGAAALFNVGGEPVHVGICTPQPRIVLHAHGDCGVDLLNIDQSVKWKGRFVGCFLPR